MHWSFEKITLPLKYSWALSRSTDVVKTNYIVHIHQKGRIYSGECAPNLRYGETHDIVEGAIERWMSVQPNAPNHIILHQLLEDASVPYSLRFAIEWAWLQCSGGIELIQSMLNIPKQGVDTFYTIPVMDPKDMVAFYYKYELNRFSRIKLKINAKDSFSLAAEALELCKGHRQMLAVDANEAFANETECLAFLQQFGHDLMFLEQPIPASATEEYSKLRKSKIKKNINTPIMADESVTHSLDVPYVRSHFDGVNIKLMKTGSFINAVNIINTARQNGLYTMVGCMVETTMAIEAACRLASLSTYADIDSFMLLENEPYQKVVEQNGRILFKESPE